MTSTVRVKTGVRINKQFGRNVHLNSQLAALITIFLLVTGMFLELMQISLQNHDSEQIS